MYAALWKMLPGGRVLKTLQAVVIAAAVIFVLFEWVFPFIAQTFLTERSTLD